MENVEGLTCYQLPDGRWCLMGDNSAYRGYVIEEEDFHTQNWTKLATSGTNSKSNTFDATFRHGTVMRLSATEERKIMETYGSEYNYNPETHYSVYVKNGTSNPFVATEGTNITVNYTAAATGNFQYWSAEGVTLTEAQKTATSLSFEMPANDVRLIAVLDVPATGIEVYPTEVTMGIGKTTELEAVIKPSDAIQSVTWSSSDETIATVDGNGEVTALKVGTAIITATSTINPELSATSTVTVTQTDISIDNRVKIAIEKIPEDSSTNYDPSFNIEANQDITINFLVAEYDENGILTNCAIQNVTLNKGSKQIIQATIPRSEGTTTYKYFIWDNNNQPLTSTYKHQF